METRQVAIVAIRVLALYVMIQGLSGLQASMPGLIVLRDQYSLFMAIMTGTFVLLGVLLWVFAPMLARLAVGKNGGEVIVSEVWSFDKALAFALVLVGVLCIICGGTSLAGTIYTQIDLVGPPENPAGLDEKITERLLEEDLIPMDEAALRETIAMNNGHMMANFGKTILGVLLVIAPRRSVQLTRTIQSAKWLR